MYLKKLADYLYRHDGSFCLTGTVINTKGDVALREGNDNLDELDLQEIRLLSALCSFKKPYTLTSIANIFEEEDDYVGRILEKLTHLGFAEEDGFDYQATSQGKNIIVELALEVMKFDKFKYKQGIQEIESLEKIVTEQTC